MKKLSEQFLEMSQRAAALENKTDAVRTTVRQKAAELKAADELADARDRADDAEAYAEIAAEFASLTATEAETALVEAKQARAEAQSLETTRS